MILHIRSAFGRVEFQLFQFLGDTACFISLLLLAREMRDAVVEASVHSCVGVSDIAAFLEWGKRG